MNIHIQIQTQKRGRNKQTQAENVYVRAQQLYIQFNKMTAGGGGWAVYTHKAAYLTRGTLSPADPQSG